MEGEGCRGACAPFFCNDLFFLNEELQTASFEVELIINNAPLTYVYLNAIETCLTFNQLLFGRQLLYSCNTTSTVVRNLMVLSSTTDKINRISNHFLDRWNMNLHEKQPTSKLNRDSLKINVKNIVLVFDEKVPRHLWRIPIVTQVFPSRDSEIRRAILRITNTNTILKRPVNKLFAFENAYQDTNQTDKTSHKEISFPSPAVL